jgi:hypothetical protein
MADAKRREPEQPVVLWCGLTALDPWTHAVAADAAADGLPQILCQIRFVPRRPRPPGVWLDVTCPPCRMQTGREPARP